MYSDVHGNKIFFSQFNKFLWIASFLFSKQNLKENKITTEAHTSDHTVLSDYFKCSILNFNAPKGPFSW